MWIFILTLSLSLSLFVYLCLCLCLYLSVSLSPLFSGSRLGLAIGQDPKSLSSIHASLNEFISSYSCVIERGYQGAREKRT